MCQCRNKIIKIITKNSIVKKKIRGGISLNTEIKKEHKDEHINQFFEDYNDSYFESDSNSSILPFNNKELFYK